MRFLSLPQLTPSLTPSLTPANACRSAIAVTSTHANTLYNYAVLLDSHLKRKPEAEVLYRRCLETQPRHAFALYNLAVLREEMINNLIHKSALAKHALSVLEAKANEDNVEETERERAAHATAVLSEEKEQDLLAGVSQLYERAVEADSNDFTALADCGRLDWRGRLWRPRFSLLFLEVA
jgi:hypothetical protein